MKLFLITYGEMHNQMKQLDRRRRRRGRGVRQSREHSLFIVYQEQLVARRAVLTRERERERERGLHLLTGLCTSDPRMQVPVH